MQWLVGENVQVTELHAVGIPILTNKVDAANARLEFSSGAVANITASRVGTEKIRKMRFFQPHDYVAVDYTTKRASISSLAPPTADGSWPGVHVRNLDVLDVEPLRAECTSSRPLNKGNRHQVRKRRQECYLSCAGVQESIREHAALTKSKQSSSIRRWAGWNPGIRSVAHGQNVTTKGPSPLQGRSPMSGARLGRGIAIATHPAAKPYPELSQVCYSPN